MPVTARGLVPRLGRGAWVVLAADLLSAVGTGMTLPFLLVYLHTVRGLSLPMAGAVAASIAVASLAGNPLGGAGSDRIGPRATLAAGLAVAAAGALMLAGAHSPWQAFAGAAGSGLGVSVAWPAQDVLLSRLAGAGTFGGVRGPLRDDEPRAGGRRAGRSRDRGCGQRARLRVPVFG